MTANAKKIQLKHALISSWRKEPAVLLAKVLNKSGVKITASGGTAQAIEDAGIEVTRLEKYTGFNNLLGGRVKTLHPAVHAAILARRENPEDLKDLQQLGMIPFDIVAVDLYPFPASKNGTDEVSVELIDIGGVAMIRAAAKNFEHVAVFCTADQFEDSAAYLDINGCSVSPEYLRQLAKTAFEHTSAYDNLIASSF